MRVKGESQLLASYAFQKAVDQQTDDELPNSPHHVAKVRISLPMFTPRSFFSIEGLYLSSRATLLGARVSSAATVNVFLTQPLGQSWALLAGLRNVFDVAYSDPVSAPAPAGCHPPERPNGQDRIALDTALGTRTALPGSPPVSAGNLLQRVRHLHEPGVDLLSG